MKGLKTLLGIALATTGFGGAVAAGVASTTISSDNIQVAKAETAVTVYCAIDSGTIGSYTLKVNANIGDNNTWRQSTMTLVENTTYSGKIVYTGTFNEKYGGVDALQFQLYDNSTWKDQKQPYSSWTTSGTFSGKLFVYEDETWVSYSLKEVTKKEVTNGTLGSTIGTDHVVVDSNYPTPKAPFKTGYSFDGWYTDQSCTLSYSEAAVTSNMTIYAKYTTSSSFDGTVNIDLRSSGWLGGAGKYAVYFWNDKYTTDVNGWSSFVSGVASTEHLVTANYSLNFEPTKMIVVKYNNSATKVGWENKADQTVNIDKTDMVVVRNTKDDKNYQVYTGYVKVLGGPSGGSWSEITTLNHVKSNGSHNVEYYSDIVTLTAGNSFKIVDVDGVYYGNYDAHSSIKANFSGGGENDINVITGGTYAFYFDSINHSVYITTIALAAADEWAQYFLANVGCDETGVALPTGWNACATEYSKLSGDAKNIIYGATAKEDGSYVEQAVARYDHAVKAHSSLTKFIVNSSDVVRASAPTAVVTTINKNDKAVVIAVIVTSTIALSFACGYFILRKKRFEK